MLLMPNDFELLVGFLERHGDEVEGRELAEPPARVRGQLRALARGDLGETERQELLALLGQNPGWVARLAEEVKALRDRPGTRG
jgi:hypothetical protein